MKKHYGIEPAHAPRLLIYSALWLQLNIPIGKVGGLYN